MGRKVSTTECDTDAASQSRSTKCLSEEEVLQPVSKTIGSDDWPIYLLQDAVVYGKDGETLANLLHTELEGPFSIRGKLVVDRDYHHFRILKDKEYKDCLVEVTNVRGFSIGDGPITLWANGKAGWFEIKPAPIYQEIYNRMTEAIELYYILCDIHTDTKSRGKGKSQKPPDVEQVLDKCIKEKGNKSTQAKMKKLCLEHAKFLLSQMKNRSSADMGWKTTPFFKWLVQNSPDITKQHNPTGRQASISATDQSGSKGKPASSQAAKNKPIGAAATILQFMNDLHTSGFLRIPRMNIRSLARIMYERFEIIDEDLAKEVIQVHAKTIYHGLGEEWAGSPIFHKLEILSTGHQKVADAECHKQAIGLVLLMRDGIEDEKREVAEPSPTPEPVHRRAGKGAGKGAGKAAGLRLKSTPASQQKRSPTPYDDEPDMRSAKRQKMKDAAAKEESAEDEFEEDEDEGDDGDELPIEFDLESTVLPSSAPQGPNGLWTCHKEACGHTIPNAGEPDGRAKVQSHFLWHADEIAARENLVIEAQRPYLPISNLLDKLKRLGEMARLREDDGEKTAAGKDAPAPIKRRLAA
ncbi:hypothetical protein V499_02804 [Pseudogymnoascus sp. VKM F-103]|uniref:DNA (cytosine-5)-methyltransferase 1 replication foci domain-containing protein n=1 Tax=Pseudogymnoascus verrucosus TaxID=342668 RepID=A0A1B8G8G2_9PEZI|nr:uncharacterized protein VE01_09786 [Pseudogymnoascus verrucosus]KFY77935.1 hypothetical protein V499_02804 [Pseudogymnoascus sp. VKM F-103]OBT92101.1 hypothetical protein VE01_09786 [Pseudogymnoascus verrucosus]